MNLNLNISRYAVNNANIYNKRPDNAFSKNVNFAQKQDLVKYSSAKNFDVCEIEKRLEFGLEEGIGIDIKPYVSYSEEIFSHFLGIARKCMDSNSPSLLDEEYKKLKSELGEEFSEILDDRYEDAIGFYGNMLRFAAWKAKNIASAQGKKEEFQSIKMDLKNELVGKGFVGFADLSDADQYGNGHIIEAFIRNVTYSLYEKAGFQIPSDDSKFMSGFTSMSMDQMEYFLKEYSCIFSRHE